MNAIIYDIEIYAAIPPKDGKLEHGIAYCSGWRDHANMGITVIGAYDYAEDRYRVFCQDNLTRFIKLCEERELLVGFNNIPFDNAVIAASEVIDYCLNDVRLTKQLFDAVPHGQAIFDPKTGEQVTLRNPFP